jgi:hypothetical protein
VFRVCRVFLCVKHGSSSAEMGTSVSPWREGGREPDDAAQSKGAAAAAAAQATAAQAADAAAADAAEVEAKAVEAEAKAEADYVAYMDRRAEIEEMVQPTTCVYCALAPDHPDSPDAKVMDDTEARTS